MPLGSELAHTDSYSAFEKIYIRIFGIPINGLRIRARRVLPKISSKFKNIMDAGCGLGIFTIDIAKRFPGSNVTGFDIDEQALEIGSGLMSWLALNELKN